MMSENNMMDNSELYENLEITNSNNNNTEYVPTKCRVTKPPPPKPATNPMQFVKVAPCPLFQKAQEQIKKVEEIKKEQRKEVREEAEDWQLNLDNWKSGRRKRQEHIIERVVEVKKLEQEEQDRHRRKSKTFNEMMEDRSKGRHKFNIPVYNDDDDDFSDYGITTGSSSSKTNSIKDVDTDDSSSILDDKETNDIPFSNNNSNGTNNINNNNNKNTHNASNQSRDDDRNFVSTTTSASTTSSRKSPRADTNNEEQYTYEGAIQDYRSRIRSKIHVDESIFGPVKNHDDNGKKVQEVLPRRDIIGKRKELFEAVEINNYESPTLRRLSEDFANSQSIKQRLKSLEKCTEQALLTGGKIETGRKLQKVQELDAEYHGGKTPNNNNLGSDKLSSVNSPPSTNNDDDDAKNNHGMLLELNSSGKEERCSSPETELYLQNLKTFSKDLDNYMIYNITGINPNYPPSTSSTEMTGGISSDREDSGIHTADVSCSVSQADEPVEDLALNTIPSCIEKLTLEEDNKSKQRMDELIYATEKLIESLKIDSSQNLVETPKPVVEPVQETPKLYENIIFNNDIIMDADFPLAPPPMMEPPKMKPPPPPPPVADDDDDNVNDSSATDIEETVEMRRLNSTKRIKREIHIKRSSFLGLDEPSVDQMYLEMSIDKPPDINTFLQKESKLEKSLYKKSQEENRLSVGLSKVESHDSGLDIDRGRLSSDTWCSSIGDDCLATPSPERHDSEQANSITSEEDEITKKEREIIELVEKEEKSRPSHDPKHLVVEKEIITPSEPFLSPNYMDDQDSEVLKVEKELQQLEEEELKRQRENILFQENRRAKARLQHQHHSMENIFDEIYRPYDHHLQQKQPHPPQNPMVNYRKSMPELADYEYDYRNSVPKNLGASSSTYPIYSNMDQYRKSMPDIQHAYNNPNNAGTHHNSQNHRQSLPDIQMKKQQPIMPGKPLRPLLKSEKDRFLLVNPSVSDGHVHVDNNGGSRTRPLSKHSLQALSASPKARPVDNWIQPRSNNPKKNYKHHWLVQEAELRRITEQQKNSNRTNQNWQQAAPEKHLPDSVIQTLTQRAQNRAELYQIRSPEGSPSKIKPPTQHPYLGHHNQGSMGHALSVPYPNNQLEKNQDRMLSVSGKKKCSNCTKELGRGAAMIIESLCLFYHLECFVCCVCHMQLGDGRMGTDVRVRNQKLHCHNCYSSEDGIKFSCV